MFARRGRPPLTGPIPERLAQLQTRNSRKETREELVDLRHLPRRQTRLPDNDLTKMVGPALEPWSLVHAREDELPV